MSCKNCTERRINCHAVCEKYIKWKAEDDKRKEEIRKKRDELVNITGYEKQRQVTSELFNVLLNLVRKIQIPL